MKIYEATTLIIASSILLWMGYGVIFEGKVSTPPYKKIKKQNGYEIREYQKLTVIKTSATNQNSGFRQLFRMINGENADNEKIPMTAPVIQDQTSMMFVMPDDMNNVPTPNSQNVQVQSMAPLTVAVKSFRGSSSKAIDYLNALKEQLEKDNISSNNDWFLCQYNSPWVFPLLRKNEIWIVVN